MTTGYDRSSCPLPSKGIQSLIADALRDNWDREAFTEYKGATLLFRDVAERIARLHILFKETGIMPGDRIAICGRNSSGWAVACLAIMSYGAVAVPILHEFKPDNIHHIINHCEARMFFAAKHIWDHLVPDSMPAVEAVLSLESFSVFLSRNSALDSACSGLDGLFKSLFPNGFTKDDVCFTDADPESLAMINYTSGSTGFSKGVMLPCRSILNNRLFSTRAMYDFQAGYEVLSMLPMAHMYGFSFEFFYEFTKGCHIYFLNRLPSPRIIFEALGNIKPRLIVSVPLVIEKIVRKNVMPRLEKPLMKFLLKLPVAGNVMRRKIGQELVSAFGGRFFEVIIGGAAFSHEVEQFLASVNFPYTVGYGATECGPIITYQDKGSFVQGSCGVPAPNMEVRILSSDPQNIAGEIVCKGPNVMLGYYKDPEYTKQVIDEEGWFHTGDIGTMIDGRYLKITDRKKEIFKLSTGKYIAPQVLENKLNESDFINNSIVIGANEKFASAIIIPTFDTLHFWCAKHRIHYENNSEMISIPEVQKRIQEEVDIINKDLAEHERIHRIRLVNDEWTPQTGELSQTLKLRRAFVLKKYENLCRDIYNYNNKEHKEEELNKKKHE